MEVIVHNKLARFCGSQCAELLLLLLLLVLFFSFNHVNSLSHSRCSTVASENLPTTAAARRRPSCHSTNEQHQSTERIYRQAVYSREK